MGCRWRETSGWHALTPIRAYMDEMTLVTTTVPCMKRILERLNKNLKWAGMKIKPSKSISNSISRGNLSDRKFVIDEEKNLIIREKAVKSLSRWYQADLNDGEQAVQFRKDVAEGLDRLIRASRKVEAVMSAVWIVSSVDVATVCV